MQKSYNSVQHILETLGYDEVRPTETEIWKPLDDVNGHFGTTDDTQVVSPGAGEKYARLEDAETGKCVALARKKSPGQSAGDYAGQEGDKHILDRLSLGNDLPNARTAAYLLGMTYAEGRDVADHEALVRWAVGIKFTDLDGAHQCHRRRRCRGPSDRREKFD